MHVFRIHIEDYGDEECAFFAMTREEARAKFEAWLKTEPYITEITGPERTGRESAPPSSVS